MFVKLIHDSIRSWASSNDILVVKATAAATEACQVCDKIGCWRHKSTYKLPVYRLEIGWLDEYVRSRANLSAHTHARANTNSTYICGACTTAILFLCLLSPIEKEKWNQNIRFFFSKQNKEPKHIADNQTEPTTHKNQATNDRGKKNPCAVCESTGERQRQRSRSETNQGI